MKIGDAIAIVPKEGFESDLKANPFISYNCLRLIDSYAVVSNGSQTDPVTEKLELGMNMRDALVTVLHAMDYEHDDYNTPRIAGIVDRTSRTGTLGIIRRDALLVKSFELNNGEAYYVATYEHDIPSDDFHDGSFHVNDADGACQYILGKGVFADLERPISSACAFETETGYSVGNKDL